MPGLKVVALISGGKDSFFSILHCLANGHEVVALANLHPSLEDGQRPEDVDSFMYQTVGHSIIPLYEKALGLPLYRQNISGSAADSNKSYTTPRASENTEPADETESLLPLLRRVMAAHPDVNAVSTGAILSDYQRTRVESIAIRLGLTALSYLWQYPFLPPYSETSLLDDMAAVGQDARIIKVASGGLDGSFLWQNVADARIKGRLVKAMQRFGTIGDGATVGEGGEFETLAIDGPWSLWKYSIQVRQEDQFVVRGDAGVISLKLKSACVDEKDHLITSDATAALLERLRMPPLLDDKFLDIQSRMTMDHATLNKDEDDHTPILPSVPIEFKSTWTTKTTDDLVILSNCISTGSNAADQMRNTMKRIADNYFVPSSIAFTTILLRNMEDFAGVNAAYGAVFTAPNPPSRVTIACGNLLPEGVDVSLSVVALHGPTEKTKQGLHVQSQSYWAPANIGPYSQAISVPTQGTGGSTSSASMVYIAGQIPLVPRLMDFPERGASSAEEHFGIQAILSLQHLWRIGQITNVKLWLGTVAFVAKESDVSAIARVRTAVRIWKLAHTPSSEADSDDEESDDELDVWDRTHGHYQSHSHSGTSGCIETKRPDVQTSLEPPCFVAEVEELPRSAPIEWASIGLATSSSIYDMHGEISVNRVQCVCLC